MDAIILGFRQKIFFKVRKIVKKFRKSPVLNDWLQREGLGANKPTKALALDTKTRWNSLLRMLNTYLEMHEEVDNTLKGIEGESKYIGKK